MKLGPGQKDKQNMVFILDWRINAFSNSSLYVGSADNVNAFL